MQVNVENVFNSIFQTIIFRKFIEIKGPLANTVPFTKLFYGVHSFFITNMGDMWKRSPLLNHLQARNKVTP
jgi:hypothetical protein